MKRARDKYELVERGMRFEPEETVLAERTRTGQAANAVPLSCLQLTGRIPGTLRTLPLRCLHLFVRHSGGFSERMARDYPRPRVF
jgi:hypothetical protein